MFGGEEVFWKKFFLFFLHFIFFIFFFPSLLLSLSF